MVRHGALPVVGGCPRHAAALNTSEVRGYDYLNAIRLLAGFGETGWVGGFTTLSGPQEGRETRAVTGGKFLHFPHRGARALDFAKCTQEPQGRGHVWGGDLSNSAGDLD